MSSIDFALANILKKESDESPAEFFEPLTFGELKIGQKFISLPRPGDNHGHGGFRKGSYLFIKRSESSAFCIRTSNDSSCPSGMPVYLILT